MSMDDLEVYSGLGNIYRNCLNDLQKNVMSLSANFLHIFIKYNDDVIGTRIVGLNGRRRLCLFKYLMKYLGIL